jgi:hypothetical protein
MMQVTKVWWDGEKLMAEPIDPASVYKEAVQPATEESSAVQPAPVQEPVAWVEYETGNHTKRPQNCGTGYCSCIECVMEPAPVPMAHIVGEIDHTGKVWTPAQPALTLEELYAISREVSAEQEHMRDTIDMAKEAGLLTWLKPPEDVIERFKAFEALVRADAIADAVLAEREACAKECKFDRTSADVEIAIRARGQE